MRKRFFSDKRFDGVGFFRREKNRELVSNSQVRDQTSVFQEDIARIIYSSAFRRLQNKTQVHPLPDTDYYRNRLTHSLEVSEVGQLIVGAVASQLKQKQRLPKNVSRADLKDIVAAACLIHDIGNPPFGHNGEEAIQSWFHENRTLPVVKEAFSEPTTKRDFLSFDGNAQGFRVVNRLQTWCDLGGMRLSLAAIGASVKYPNSSLTDHKGPKKKKFGYMHPDRILFERIFGELGLQQKDQFIRHPLAYIVEAADDIAYLATDIEDATKSGSISFERGYELLDACSDPFHKKRLQFIDTRNRDEVIKYLRAAAVSTMVDSAFVVFVEDGNLDKIASGNFRGSLLESSRFAKQVKEIRDECRNNVYRRRGKLETEAGGHHVIEEMLSLLLGAVNELFEKEFRVDALSKKSANIYHLLPSEMRLHEFRTDDAASLCYRMVDYVSGMTDTYIVRMYRTLFGGQLLAK